VSSYRELLQSAEQYGLAASEQNIASWIRRYVEPTIHDWHSVENTALRVLLDLATLSASELFQPDGVSDIAANVLARALGNSHREAEYPTSYFASLAALTFAASGNFPSASVLASAAKASPDLGPAESWMMQVLANRKIELSRRDVPWGFVSYAQLTDHALATGRKEDFEQATEAFVKACQEAGESLVGSDRGLFLLWEQVHARMEELSIARLLRETNFPNKAYLDVLLESSSLFYPSQAQTLLNYPLTQPGEPVFITLPTSTGKSLLGELALVASLTWDDARWLGVYLAPSRALASQRWADMRRHLKEIKINCVMKRGGYLSEEPIRPGRRTVLIATPEAFDALLRQNSDLYEGLAACVFDEFHLIEQHQRGLRYEGLIGRLLQGASGEGWPKIIALSAVVEDTADVQEWLHSSVAKYAWRPTARHIAIVDPDGRIEYFTPGEGVDRRDSASMVAWRGQIQLQPGRMLDAVEIALDQFQRFQAKEPILILTSSRAGTREIAVRLLSRLPQLASDTQASRSASEIIKRYPYLYTLHRCLQHGIAYHNAALPDWVRSEVERLAKNSQLRIIATTTTLAEGVDLPFRVVVLADWRLWQFGEKQPMSSLLFGNIAGRGGRAWAYSEGDTIIVNTSSRADDAKGNLFERYIKPAPYGLRSSVEYSIRSQDQVREEVMADTWTVAESQFIAFLAACGDQGAVEQDFTDSLYAGLKPETAEPIRNVTEKLVADMTVGDLAVIERHSPMQLTSFGEVVLSTGLSPRSGVSLASFIAELRTPVAPREGQKKREQYGIEWQSLLASVWNKLCSREGTWIRELEGDYLYKRIGDRGFPVNNRNFNDTVMAWVSGVPLELIGYLILRWSSERKEQVTEWLKDLSDSPPLVFEDWIETLAIFCTSYLARQWAWIFRGAAAISKYMDNENLSTRFDELALRLEYGVGSVETAKLLQNGCPVDRAKLDRIRREYDSLPLINYQLDFPEWTRQYHRELIGLQVGPFPRIQISEQDLDDLERFFSRR